MNAPARKSPAPAAHETLTLGIEEEFHLIDLATRRSTPRAGEVLSRLLGCARGSFAAELQQTTVETNTQVVRTLDDLRRSLVAPARRADQGLRAAGDRRGGRRHDAAARPDHHHRERAVPAHAGRLPGAGARAAHLRFAGARGHRRSGPGRRADRPGGALVAAAAGAVRQLAVLARRARHRLREHANADLVALADHRLRGHVRQRRRIRSPGSGSDRLRASSAIAA